MNTKIKASLIAFALAFQSVLTPVAFADFLSIRAYGSDSVAGYASRLRTSLVNPGQDVIFVVEKPDMSVVRVPAKADLEGLAATDLYGLQTKIAGTYKLAVLYPGSPNSSPQSTFRIYPDQVSTTQSKISSTSQMVTADGAEKTFVAVTLFDSYMNPIPGHTLQLISSRPEDDVVSISGGATDAAGRANFRVTSKFPGVSVFTALDATLNKVLADREEVVFFAPTTSSGIGGNSLTADIFQANIGQGITDVLPGPVDHFDIEDLPSGIKVNTDQTVTIVARDKSNNVAKNYTGTVLISTPDDENAVLPSNGEYSFKESDQGKFTFNLALRFSKIGNQTLQVFDKNNWRVAGEKTVEVIPAQAVFTPEVSGKLVIKSPMDGGAFGNNMAVITGQGGPNINLKVFDNDVKIGDTETDTDGFFSYSAANLISGSHTFYVLSESGDVSKSVSIQIDTLPPVLNAFTVNPDGNVEPGTSLQIKLQTEPGLDQVKVRIQGVEVPLTESGDPGTYTTTVSAPAASGTFPVDVILVDRLSNKAEILNKAVVSVVSVADITPPPTVLNLEGVAGDSNVSVTWDAVTGHPVLISRYRVYYGTAYDQLNKMMETSTDASSLIVDALENGKQYFFAVTAIDTKGLESDSKSTEIAVTPMAPTEEPVSVTIDNNVDTTNGGSSAFYSATLQGAATANAVTLNWAPFPGIQPSFYKILFGFQSGHYSDYLITGAGTNSAVVRDLINGVPYYFAVVALDINGQEISSLSSELMIVPQGAAFHSASPELGGIEQSPLSNSQFGQVPKTEATGPESVWLVLISVVVSFLLYSHKRRVLNP